MDTTESGMWERRPLCSSRLDSEIRILRSLITIQLGDDVVEIAAARWSVEHAYFDTKSSSRPLALLREQLLRENRRSAGPFSHPLVSRLSVACQSRIDGPTLSRMRTWIRKWLAASARPLDLFTTMRTRNVLPRQVKVKMTASC